MGKYKPIPKIPGYTRYQVVAFMKHKIRYDRRWMLRALKQMYTLQTDLEKRRFRSIENNEMGFTSFDSPLLSMLGRISPDKLSDDRIKELHLRLPKYAIQCILLCDVNKLKTSLDNYYLSRESE